MSAGGPDRPAAELVHARLVEQLERLDRREVEARAGSDDGVHRMRVATRRLRAVLATARPLLEREQTDPLGSELRWLATALGHARDPAVVHERLRALVDAEPRSLVHGPVRRRLLTTYRGRGKQELAAALDSRRHRTLRSRLDRLVADPPWTEVAAAPAGDVLPTMLRKELKRFRTRVRSAVDADDPMDALHEARKAAKRLRYAAELTEPAAGKPARRLAKRARQVTSELGELQDVAISCAELRTLARAAEAAGEASFTYGLLLGREEEHARRVMADFDAEETLDELKALLREVRRALD